MFYQTVLPTNTSVGKWTSPFPFLLSQLSYVLMGLACFSRAGWLDRLTSQAPTSHPCVAPHVGRSAGRDGWTELSRVPVFPNRRWDTLWLLSLMSEHTPTKKSQASVRVTQILQLLYFNRIVGAVSFQAVTASRNLQVWASLNVNFSWVELLIHSANPVTFWLRLSIFKFWMISDSIRSCLRLSKTYNRRLRNCWLCNTGFNCKFTEHIASSFSEETRMVCKCDILSPGKCFQMRLGLSPAFACVLASHSRTVSHFFPEQFGVRRIKSCLEIENSTVFHQLSVGTSGL